MAITQNINPFPVPLPNRDTDTPSEFSTHVDAFLGHINTQVAEENLWGGQANSLANEVNANASDAKTYRDEAQASQNATLYDAGTTYNYDDPGPPDTVIGSNGHAYRCIINATVGDNPVGSGTGHWAQITTGSTEVFDEQWKEQEVRSFAFSLMF